MMRFLINNLMHLSSIYLIELGLKMLFFNIYLPNNDKYICFAKM